MNEHYRFLSSPIGRELGLSDNNTIAVRNRAEYMDSVAFLHPPLKLDHHNITSFTVQVLEVQNSWSGTLKVGITAKPPNFHDIDGVHPEDFESSWVFQPSKLGIPCEAEDVFRLELRITHAMSNSGTFYLFRNNALVSSIVEPNLDINCLYYGVCELYGQCVSLKLLEVMTAADADLPVFSAGSIAQSTPTFDSDFYGARILLKSNNTIAERTSSFMESIVFVNEPCLISDTSIAFFEIGIKTIQSSWSGSIKLGFTHLSPSDCREVVNRNLSEIDTIWNFDADVIPLHVDDVLRAEFVDHGCDNSGESRKIFSLYQNGKLVHELEMGEVQLPAAPWYGVIEVYGKCSSIKLLSSSGTTVAPIKLDDLLGLMPHERIAQIERLQQTARPRELAILRRLEMTEATLKQQYIQEMQRLQMKYESQLSAVKGQGSAALEGLKMQFEQLESVLDEAKQQMHEWESKLQQGLVEDMDEDDVIVLLSRLGVDVDPAIVRENRITGNILMDFSEADVAMRLMIRQIGPRKRLMRAINQLRHAEMPSLKSSGSNRVSNSSPSSIEPDTHDLDESLTAPALTLDELSETFEDSVTDPDIDENYRNSQASPSNDNEDEPLTKEQVLMWTATDVASFFCECFGSDADPFGQDIIDHDIAGDVLPLLTSEDLRSLEYDLDYNTKVHGWCYDAASTLPNLDALPGSVFDVRDADNEADLSTDTDEVVKKLVEKNRMLRMRLEASKIERRESVSIPPEFLCPITRDVMSDPVIALDGHTYERSAIEAWFEAGNSTSPVTRMPIDRTVIPAFSIKSHIKRYLNGEA